MMIIRTERLPNATRRGQKRIFAVVSRPVTVRGKTVRHVLIFDNDPASLRLLVATGAAPGRRSELWAVLALLLVLAATIAMFWPLL
jgi:hypothetical protein